MRSHNRAEWHITAWLVSECLLLGCNTTLGQLDYTRGRRALSDGLKVYARRGPRTRLRPLSFTPPALSSKFVLYSPTNSQILDEEVPIWRQFQSNPSLRSRSACTSFEFWRYLSLSLALDNPSPPSSPPLSQMRQTPACHQRLYRRTSPICSFSGRQCVVCHLPCCTIVPIPVTTLRGRWRQLSP